MIKIIALYHSLWVKVRIFFVTLENFSTLLIPSINIKLEAIPGEIKYIDLTLTK